MIVRPFVFLAALTLLPTLVGCSVEPGPPPAPTPETEPAPAQPALTLEQAQGVFNAAVLAALRDPVVARDAGDAIVLAGSIELGSSSARFDAVALGKAPFVIEGIAWLEVGDEVARIEFDGAPLGATSVADFDLGYVEVEFPAVPAFTEAALDLLLIDGLECADLDYDFDFGSLWIAGSCGATVAGHDVMFSYDFTVALPGTVDGYLACDTPYVEVRAEFEDRSAFLLVNGTEVLAVDDITEVLFLLLGLGL